MDYVSCAHQGAQTASMVLCGHSNFLLSPPPRQHHHHPTPTAPASASHLLHVLWQGKWQLGVTPVPVPGNPTSNAVWRRDCHVSSGLTED